MCKYILSSSYSPSTTQQETKEGLVLLSILLYIVIIAIALYVNYIVAKKFEEIAFSKGYDKHIHSFDICFWLSIIGYLYVIALPDLHITKNQKRILEAIEKIEASSNTPPKSQNNNNEQ